MIPEKHINLIKSTDSVIKHETNFYFMFNDRVFAGFVRDFARSNAAIELYEVFEKKRFWTKYKKYEKLTDRAGSYTEKNHYIDKSNVYDVKFIKDICLEAVAKLTKSDHKKHAKFI